MRATKGHKDLIDAIAPLMASRPKLHLVFVGGGSPVFEQTQEYVAQLGLQDRIHLMGMRRDVPAGRFRPVRAGHPAGSVRHRLRRGAGQRPARGRHGRGRRVRDVPRRRDRHPGAAQDPAALAAALTRLIDDPALRRAMGEAGRKLVWDEGVFSPSRLAETTEAVYGKWLAERGK